MITKNIAYISPTTGYTEEEKARWRGHFGNLIPSGFSVEFRSIDGGPEFFDEMKHFEQALAAAPDYYSSLKPTEVHVAIAAGAIDPGLSLIREASSVPVIGPGEASMFIASLTGRPTSLVTVDEHAVVKTEAFINLTEVKPPIVGVRSIDFPVRQLVQDPATADSLLVEQCRKAVEVDGAEAVYLACMPFGKLPSARSLAELLGVPVYNPWLIALTTAVEAARAQP